VSECLWFVIKQHNLYMKYVYSHAPLVVFSVPSKRPSVLTFRARKNRNPASFVPQVNTAADDNVTLKHVDENRVGKEASAKAPVPNRSK